MPEIDATKVKRTGANAHAEYFGVGSVPVTWMAKYQLYACLKCRLNDCAHTRAVHKFVNMEREA